MSSRILVLALLLFPVAHAPVAAQSVLPGFRESGPFEEQVRWLRLESGVRVFVDAPLHRKTAQRLLIVYATPNGNTIEQTLGCRASPSIGWRFDIQHVAAQVRCFRKSDPSRDVVLAVVQAPQRSWPAFRQAETQPGRIISELVESLVEMSSADRVVLACHSGGGSFVWGYLNEHEAIPSSVERIVLLDANYSYSDEERHGDKLLAWLGGDSARRLIVVAYDDREITYKGKKVVGPDGGTFRASERMLARFRRDEELAERPHGDFRRTMGRSGQMQFFVHPNPENKILHTALVGEMNGLIHGLTVGTPEEETWGGFGGPRAYSDWVQQDPFVEPDPVRAEIPPDLPAVRLNLPPRPDNAPTGSEFVQQVAGLSLDDREAAVVREVFQGNVPEFLRQLKPVALAESDPTDARHVAICWVMSDYMAVGTNDDFFRFPLTPRAAMRLADALGGTLMTPKISDAIHAAAGVRLRPQPLTKDREAVETFYEHHKLIEQQRAGKPGDQLVSGIKKDLVWSGRLLEKPHKVAIYGWHYPEGEPIQPLYVGHWDRYVDYSHGLRLVAEEMMVDGRKVKLPEILADENLCNLVTEEGPINVGEVRKASDWDR